MRRHAIPPPPPQASDDELFVEFSKSLPIATAISSLEKSMDDTTPALNDDADYFLSMLVFYSNVTNPFVSGIDFDRASATVEKTFIRDGRPKAASGTSTSIYEVQLDVSVPYKIYKTTSEDAGESAAAEDAEKRTLVVSGVIYTKEVSGGTDSFESLEMKIYNMSVNNEKYKDISFLLEGSDLTSAKVDGKEVQNKQALLPLIVQFMQHGS